MCMGTWFLKRIFSYGVTERVRYYFSDVGGSHGGAALRWRCRLRNAVRGATKTFPAAWIVLGPLLLTIPSAAPSQCLGPYARGDCVRGTPSERA